MQLTIADDHVQDLRFALAEQALADEELIERVEKTSPGRDTSGVVERIAFYRELGDQVAA